MKQTRILRLCAVPTLSISFAIALLGAYTAGGATLINETFGANPNFHFGSNGVYNLNALGASQWGAGQLDSTIWSDIDGETVADLEDGLVYSDERTRSFVYYLDLGAAQTTYSIGDSFTASVNVGANTLAEFGNMTANIGVFTTDNLALAVDTVHSSASGATMELFFTNEGSIPAGDFEFYQLGVTTMTDAGVTASGIALPGGEGQPIGSDANNVVNDGLLALNGTFTEAHRYLGIVLLSNVGTNTDNTRWMSFDNATLDVVPEPSCIAMAGLGLLPLLIRRRRGGHSAVLGS